MNRFVEDQSVEPNPMNTPDKPNEQSNTLQVIFKNTTYVTVGIILLKVINFVFNVYVVRRLGDERFGQYSIVLAFVGLFQIFAELGISQYVMREIARDIRKANELTWNLIMLRVVLAVVAMIVLPLIASSWGYSPELVLGILIYSATFLLAAFSVPFGDVLAASEQLGYVTAINVISQIIFVVLGTIFLLSGLGFIWLIIASLLSTIPRIAISIWSIRKLKLAKLPFKINLASWPELIRAGLPFGITSLMQSIAFSLDTVILSLYESESAVGWYNVAYNLIFSIIFLFGGFKTALVPSLSKVFIQDRSKIDEWYRGTFKFSFLFSTPIAFGGMILAFPIITFLYTREFLPAALAFQILIWDLPFLLYTSLAGDMAIIIGEEKHAARINIVNTIANVFLNLILIPRFGLVGAAFVTVITDMVSALQFHLLLRGKLNLPDMRMTMFKVGMASIMMAIPLFMVNGLNFHPIIGILGGAAIYTILVYLFKLLDPRETQMLMRLIHKIRFYKKVDEPI